MKTENEPPATVEGYPAALPEDIRKALQDLREVIRAAVPVAKERRAYRIPLFSLQRDPVGEEDFQGPSA